MRYAASATTVVVDGPYGRAAAASQLDDVSAEGLGPRLANISVDRIAPVTFYRAAHALGNNPDERVVTDDQSGVAARPGTWTKDLWQGAAAIVLRLPDRQRETLHGSAIVEQDLGHRSAPIETSSGESFCPHAGVQVEQTAALPPHSERDVSGPRAQNTPVQPDNAQTRSVRSAVQRQVLRAPCRLKPPDATEDADPVDAEPSGAIRCHSSIQNRADNARLCATIMSARR